MEFDSTKHGDKLLVMVKGRLDAITASEFDAECAKWLNNSETKVIADLAGLEYISSAGLRSILTSAKQLRGVGGSLSFSGLSGMVDEVFTVSGFSAMFNIYETAEAALAD